LDLKEASNVVKIELDLSPKLIKRRLQ